MAIDKDILLSKWYNQDISTEELAVLKEMYDLDELRTSLELMNQYEIDVVPADVGWSGFEKLIDVQKNEDVQNINDPVVDDNQKAWRKSWVKPLLWSLLIAILGIAAYFYFTFPLTLIENKGQEEYLYAFSEGSESVITPGSSIAYDKEDFDNNRVVELSGEALFNVEKGDSFKVKTNAGQITVLGTSFDVWQISDHTLRVECYEGRVSVSDNGRQEVILDAGESVYLRDQSFSAKEKIKHLTPDWKRERKQYVGITVKDLIADVSRFYDYRLILEDIDMSDLFTGVIPINDIDKTSEYLATTLGWRYEKKNKTYIFYRQ